MNILLIWIQHHVSEEMQNLGICSAPIAFKQGRFFIVPRTPASDMVPLPHI